MFFDSSVVKTFEFFLKTVIYKTIICVVKTIIKMEILEEMFFSSSSSSSSSTDSSSSSDDEEFMELRKLLFFRENKHRVNNFVTDVVDKYSEIEFRQNFRVSKTTAEKLANRFENSQYFKKKKCGGRKEISAKEQVLAFLWFAGNKETYRGVANLFNISISSAHSHLTHFLDFLYEISPTFIKFPATEEEKNAKAQAFSQISGIDNTLGCIDGCYIYIRSPAHKNRSTYVNRHGLISMTLQGICDADKKFLDVCVGSPSKIHDARIFTLSYISKELPTICGDKYHLLGDAAYPIREYLLTPYKDFGTLTEKQKSFNKKHCHTRVKIENAFGLLKQRFRQSIRLDFFKIERMCKFVLGCCVLHNLCIEEADLWEIEDEVSTEETSPQVIPVTDNSSSEMLSNAVLKRLGELKRNRITQAL